MTDSMAYLRAIAKALQIPTDGSEAELGAKIILEINKLKHQIASQQPFARGLREDRDEFHGLRG